jgi:hypothetical protein
VHSLFGLTSHVLLVLTVVVAVAAPCALALLWARRRRTPASTRGRVGLGAAGLSLALVAQASAVAAVLLAINGQYQFYSSWGDLLGRQSGPAAITVSGSRHPGNGRLEILHVDGKASHTRADVLVWLPKQYGEPAYAHHRFPVVMYLPGQPEQPMGAFQGFQLASAAANEIDAHKVPPFVIVVPPLMIRPPSDTECTDVPHGPKAESWLSSDVPNAVQHDLRVQPPGKHWSVMGWSTGGFCAAKLLYSHPKKFAAAVGVGAYYQPYTGHAYPNLFGGSVVVQKRNSPQWLYLHHPGGLTGRLLIISSKADGESWASSEKMLAATRDNPQVSHVVLGSGGHNFRVYQPYVQASFQWLDHAGAFA